MVLLLLSRTVELKEAGEIYWSKHISNANVALSLVRYVQCEYTKTLLYGYLNINYVLHNYFAPHIYMYATM